MQILMKFSASTIIDTNAAVAIEPAPAATNTQFFFPTLPLVYPLNRSNLVHWLVPQSILLETNESKGKRNLLSADKIMTLFLRLQFTAALADASVNDLPFI